MTNREKHSYRDIPVCDTHLHPADPRPLTESAATLRDIIDYFAYDRAVLCCLNSSRHRVEGYENLKGLYLKSALNAHDGEDKVLLYGHPFHHGDDRDTAEGYLRQVQTMHEWGMDGVKILDGKPEYRRDLGRPLCDPIFDLMYAYLEEMGIPVKLHLGDPDFFWGDRDTVGETIIRRGWWYGGGGFPSLDSLRDEVEGVLRKFPRLKLCLAHFYFMSEEPDRLRAFFDRWENVAVDLTPGTEMFRGMTAHAEAYQRFFAEYSHRIYFGTDTYNSAVPGDDPERYANAGGGRYHLVRRMMEGKREDEFSLSVLGTPATVRPLGLPDAQLNDIYFANHHRLHPTVRPLNYAAIADALERLELSTVTAEDRDMEAENLALMRVHFSQSKG